MMLDDTLCGYRVLDLSQYLPGPYATRLLADLGAEVVKVEPPSGDPMRNFIFVDEDDISPLYKQINTGKTIVRIDLKSDEGRNYFRDLVASADVLLESYRPGVMERLGFAKSTLKSLNPRLIHCALSGFGQDGPASLRAGHDLTYLALSGMLSHTGTEDIPVIPFPPVSDYAGGQQAATMILAAILRREKSGKGTYIDTSLYESILSWQSFGQAGSSLPGRLMDPGHGLITGGMACYQIYPTADDRFVVLGALEEKFWSAFCAAVDRREWINRHKEPMPQYELIGELRELFLTETRQRWVELLAETDCCFEPLLEPEEIGSFDHVVSRQLLEPSRDNLHPVDVRSPVKLDGRYPRSRQGFLEEEAGVVTRRWRTKCSSPDGGKRE